MSSWLIWLEEMEKHLEGDMARRRTSVCNKSQISAWVHAWLHVNTRKCAGGNPSMTCTALWYLQKPLSPLPMGPLHAGDSHSIHPGQCKLQQYDRSSGFYPNPYLFILSTEEPMRMNSSPSIISYFVKKEKISDLLQTLAFNLPAG